MGNLSLLQAVVFEYSFGGHKAAGVRKQLSMGQCVAWKRVFSMFSEHKCYCRAYGAVHDVFT